MTNPPVPAVDCHSHHTTAVVTNLQAAIDFYTKKLGFSPSFMWGDPPRFGGVTLGNVQFFLRKARRIPTDSRSYSTSATCTELCHHKASGVEIAEEMGDREYRIRDYGVRDLDGYHLSFGRSLSVSARRSRSSVWTCRSAWRSGSRRCCMISPSTSG